MRPSRAEARRRGERVSGEDWDGWRAALRASVRASERAPTVQGPLVFRRRQYLLESIRFSGCRTVWKQSAAWSRPSMPWAGHCWQYSTFQHQNQPSRNLFCDSADTFVGRWRNSLASHACVQPSENAAPSRRSTALSRSLSAAPAAVVEATSSNENPFESATPSAVPCTTSVRVQRGVCTKAS